MSRQDKRLASLIARTLAGSWRSEVTACDLSEAELDQVTPLLMGSGAAALGWRRVRDSSLRDSPSGELLHQAYRLQSLQSEMQEQKVAKVFRLLRERSIKAILAKGWVAAGLYPDRTFRPFGDIDICVSPRDYKIVAEIFGSDEGNDCWVDLHRKYSEIGDRSFEELLSRARVEKAGSEDVLVLCQEDHLALLSIHFLKHGAWRPLWLCDVAVAVENAPAAFDWKLCFGKDGTRASWIRAAIALAERLLGANTTKVPANGAPAHLPDWLLESVLKQWCKPYALFQAPMSHPVPMSALMRRPADLLEGLRLRWPNPIIATISVNGRLNNLPRFPYQLANCLARVTRFLISGSEELQEH